MHREDRGLIRSYVRELLLPTLPGNTQFHGRYLVHVAGCQIQGGDARPFLPHIVLLHNFSEMLAPEPISTFVRKVMIFIHKLTENDARIGSFQNDHPPLPRDDNYVGKVT